MWTRKRTVIGGGHTPGDWLVLRHGQQVGRVYAVPGGAMMGPRYFWGVWTEPVASGTAETLDAALEAVRSTIRLHWPDGSTARLAGRG